MFVDNIHFKYLETILYRDNCLDFTSRYLGSFVGKELFFLLNYLSTFVENQLAISI